MQMPTMYVVSVTRVYLQIGIDPFSILRHDSSGWPDESIGLPARSRIQFKSRQSHLPFSKRLELQSLP